MKKISEQLKSITYDMFSYSGIINEFANITQFNHSLNNIFIRFLKVNSSSGIFEIPMFLRHYIERNISDQLLSNEELKDIVIFLGQNNKIQNVSNVNRLFNGIYYTSNKINNINPFKTVKSDVYHIGGGIIFDKDMNLLMLNTVEVEFKNNKVEYKKLKCYIHPSVFYSDGLVEKALVEKMIPYILKDGVFLSPSVDSTRFISNLGLEKNDIGYIRHKIKPEIIVKDVKDIFFCTPNAPSNNHNEEINNLLADDIDSVLGILKL